MGDSTLVNEVSECLYQAVLESCLASSVRGGRWEKMASMRKQALTRRGVNQCFDHARPSLQNCEK